MTQLDELARELKARYEGAPKSQKVVEIHLFGIRRAEALKSVSLAELLARAGMSDSYKTEIRKGIRLAEHVEAKA
jgi:5-methylcytosine-specific restriction protein B